MEKNKPVPVENQNIVYYQEDEIDLYELYLITNKKKYWLIISYRHH